MISITYDSMERNSKGQMLANFDIETHTFSISRLSQSIRVDCDKTVTATVRKGKLSELLDLVYSFEKEQIQNERLKRLLLSSDERKAELVLISTLIKNLEVGELNLVNIPTKIYKESEVLFYVIFGLISIDISNENECNQHLRFFYDLSCYLNSIGIDSKYSFTMLNKSLKSLPMRMQRLIDENVDLLCMAQIWYDNLHRNEELDLKNIKDKATLYLMSRPAIPITNMKLDYRIQKRRIAKDALMEFLITSSIGKTWKIDKDSRIFKEKINDLLDKKLLEEDDKSIYLTPSGIALSAYLIPRYLMFGT